MLPARRQASGKEHADRTTIDATSCMRLARHLPADSLFTYFMVPTGGPAARSAGQADVAASAPSDSGAPASAPTQVAWFALLEATGLIPGAGGVLADAAATIPLLATFPHAGALLDVRARSGPGTADSSQPSVRLERLQFTWLFLTDGRNEPVLAHLNRLLPHYANRDEATIEERRAGDARYFRLVDRRLPEWAVLEWGWLEDCYAVCIGEGAFERLHGAGAGENPALGVEDWFRDAAAQTRVQDVAFAWLIDLAALGERIEPIAGPRWRSVLEILNMSEVRRDWWSIGTRGRAVTCARMFREANRDVRRIYSEPVEEGSPIAAAIPPAARHYAVLRGATPFLMRHAPAAWVRAKYFRQLEKVERFWTDLLAEQQLDIDRDLLDRLGDDLIVFDDPPHPLGLPVAVTLVAPLRDAAGVRETIDTLLEALSRRMVESSATEPDSAWTTLTRTRLRRAADGVWYLQMGVVGPALCVSERYLVVSWSPQAVRQVRAHYDGPAASSRPANGHPK